MMLFVNWQHHARPQQGRAGIGGESPTPRHGRSLVHAGGFRAIDAAPQATSFPAFVHLTHPANQAPTRFDRDFRPAPRLRTPDALV